MIFFSGKYTNKKTLFFPEKEYANNNQFLCLCEALKNLCPLYEWGWGKETNEITSIFLIHQ